MQNIQGINSLLLIIYSIKCIIEYKLIHLSITSITHFFSIGLSTKDHGRITKNTRLRHLEQTNKKEKKKKLAFSNTETTLHQSQEN